MDQGLLVPDELVVDLVVDRVNQEDCKNGYVLDGFPRTIPQAEALDKALAANNETVDYAINVEVQTKILSIECQEEELALVVVQHTISSSILLRLKAYVMLVVKSLY